MLKKLKAKIALLKAKRDPFYWAKKPIEYKTSKQIKAAKKKALLLHEKTGKQWHIMPIGDKAIIIDNEWRKIYNKISKRRKVNINDLLKMAYFSTPSTRTLKVA
jgi:hypothetical protein